VLAQPWVDALGVVKVKAHGQQLHHLPELEGAEAHRARRHLLAGGVHHFFCSDRLYANAAGRLGVGPGSRDRLSKLAPCSSAHRRKVAVATAAADEWPKQRRRYRHGVREVHCL